jgi:hypothetical protein
MDTSLPPIPNDLWPQVIPAIGKRLPGRMLVLEIPAFSENLLLSVLCRAVYHEMRWAGEWAAQIGQTSKRDFPSARELSRHSAENAARLLTIYTAIYPRAQYQSENDPAPDGLKAGASRSYQIHLRDSLQRKQKQE